MTTITEARAMFARHGTDEPPVVLLWIWEASLLSTSEFLPLFHVPPPSPPFPGVAIMLLFPP